MDNDNFFVGIKDSAFFRKTLLESSKQILLVLKNNQRIQIIRDKKINLINDLKQQIKELILLLNKLETRMPSHEIFENLKLEGFDMEPEKKKPDQPNKKVDSIKINKEMVELDKLEKALDSIEQKLDKLN